MRSDRSEFLPSVGFHLAEQRIEVFGSPESKVAYTSKADIGRSVAQLSLLSLSSDAKVAASVPEHVRIAGSNPSFTDIGNLFDKAFPARSPFRVESLDLDEQREILKQDVVSGRLGKEDNGRHLRSVDVLNFESDQPGINYFLLLRLLFGEGKMDWSKENTNELINPGEKLWKWKTVDKFITEGGVKI